MLLRIPSAKELALIVCAILSVLLYKIITTCNTHHTVCCLALTCLLFGRFRGKACPANNHSWQLTCFANVTVSPDKTRIALTRMAKAECQICFATNASKTSQTELGRTGSETARLQPLSTMCWLTTAASTLCIGLLIAVRRQIWHAWLLYFHSRADQVRSSCCSASCFHLQPIHLYLAFFARHHAEHDIAAQVYHHPHDGRRACWRSGSHETSAYATRTQKD